MKLVKGCGKDAEIETNEKGGKQSKTDYAMHLIDGEFLNYFCSGFVLAKIGRFMQNGDKALLIEIVQELCNRAGLTYSEGLLKLGEVLKEGAKKYAPNNWRLIPQEQHINHSLIHYVAYLLGDKQDDHLGHCITRLMFAYATETSPNFSYTRFIA